MIKEAGGPDRFQRHQARADKPYKSAGFQALVWSHWQENVSVFEIGGIGLG